VPTSAGLDVNSFDPGRLDFGKKIYWRVDEVNGTPDKTVFKGDVWSFEVEPYAVKLPSDAIAVTASSVDNDTTDPNFTIDGSGLSIDPSNGVETHSNAVEDAMWMSASGDPSPWLMYEFDSAYKLDTLLIWNSNHSSEPVIGWGIKDVDIQVSTDGVNWTSIPDVGPIARVPGFVPSEAQAVDFGLVMARYVKLNILSNWGGLLPQYGVAEVQFYALPTQAREPMPASGSTDVLPNTVVSWRAGREADQHTVSVSTDMNALADGAADSVSSPTNSLDLTPLDLQLGETYYWRVDEVNNTETPAVTEGPVWSLSTAPMLVVDDFESYGNISPDRPFQTWLDGIGYSADEFFPVAFEGNGTGAGIGHDIWSVSSPHFDGSLMETVSTIPGSNQSMPFYYSNTGGAASETQREFAVAQDWTVGQAQTLSIAFRGQAGNSGTLYAKVNGIKKVYPRDSDNLALKQWQVWNIDLSSLGTNLESVTTLAIGVEGSGAAGMLLIDDIILHPEAGQLITPTAPDNTNLVAYYALDGDVADSSGAGVNGTVNGNPTYENGIDGQAIRLNGIDDFIDFGVPENWPSGAAPRTVCAWAKTYSVEPGYRVIVGYGSPVSPQATGLAMNGTSMYAFGYGSDINIGNFWAVEEWHHVGLTYDGTTLRLFADGVEVTSGQRDWDTIVTVARIGRQVNEANEFWDGHIDEVRLYDTALSADEMAWLGGKTAPIDKPFQ